ncbi:hypothetical protein ACC761_39550, partial [Rhizobium ruizarguesonis]
VPGGPNRGRLVVTLHVFDVTTKHARIIGGHDSMIDGTVRLEDAKTGPDMLRLGLPGVTPPRLELPISTCNC